MERMCYVGALFNGSTAMHRAKSLEQLGFHIDFIDSTPLLRGAKSIIFRIGYKLNYAMDINNDNDKLLMKFSENEYQVLWLDKGVHITESTFKKIKKLQPQCRIIGYSPDDMLNRRNSSFQFRRTL